MTERTVPAGYVAYRQTPVFTRDTVPPGLLKAHRIKAGSWGKLHVIEGRLLFRLHEPPSETLLDPTRPPVVIPPQARHEVALPDAGPVRFYVEFFHAGAGG